MNGSLVENRDGTKGAGPGAPFLARDRVRFVGETIAMVVADSLTQARDAIELIELDIDDLPAKPWTSPRAARGDPCGSARQPRLRLGPWATRPRPRPPLPRRPTVVSLEVGDNRIIVNSMEPRGCFAEFDGTRLHLAVNGQGVWGMKG
jgi:carbon-monoxide dehydrogenase large subunit